MPGAVQSGLPKPDNLKELVYRGKITVDELKKHRTPDDCWIQVRVSAMSLLTRALSLLVRTCVRVCVNVSVNVCLYVQIKK